MHELSIAISMIDEITEEAARRGGLAVRTVYLTLGLLSGVDREALQFCYECACEGTILEGSRLVVEVVPVVISCAVCRLETAPVSITRLACPTCNSAGKVVRGYELEVASLEVAA